MTVGAGDVVNEFYRLREQHFHKPKPFRARPAEYRDADEKLAERFLAWCRKSEIEDPLGFLRYRFEAAVHAQHTVGLRGLISEPLAKYWREWKENQTYADRQNDRLQREAGTRREQAVKALRLLTPGMEAAKHPYASSGRYELCLAQREYTGGFHPQSTYCPTCPIGVRCAAALYKEHGFDVVSLRAGRLNLLPKEVAAAAVR